MNQQRNRKNYKRRNNRRNNRNKKGKGPKFTGLDNYLMKYYRLLDTHLEARTKYYDLFTRADPRQLEKLERIFTNTMNEVRKFEESVPEEFKEDFFNRINGKEFDTTYSSNHNLPTEVEAPPAEGDYDDPHLLPTQIEHEFKGDTEESEGTYEDYKKLKGIVDKVVPEIRKDGQN